MSSICVINSTLPAYQPNVFICPNGSACCKSNGIPTCCQNDVSFLQLLNQCVPFLVMFVLVFGIAFLVRLFFDDEDTTKPENQTNKLEVVKYILPSDEDYTVEDPVFGRLYEHNIAKYASKPTSHYPPPKYEETNSLIPLN